MPQSPALLLQEMYLDVGNGHNIFFSEHGNPLGPAYVVLHGGPGSSCGLSMLDWFDLSTQRVILPDQRGAGKSRPQGETRHNNTAELLLDLEKLRQSLGIKRWSVVGGSWGSALAVMYAGTYPQHVSSMVLRGVFLTSPREMRWFFQSLAALVPEAWHELTLGWTVAQKMNVLQFLALVFQNGTPEQIIETAGRWQIYEESIMRAMAGAASITPVSAPGKPGVSAHTINKYRLQAHYLFEHCFLGERRIFRAARAAAHIPTTIVHGTHDWICPPENVTRLIRFMPKARVHWVKKGTHTTADPLIQAALRAAIIDSGRAIRP